MTDLALVTGGAGFIGSALVHGLLGESYVVRVLDDLSTGNRTNLVEVEDDVDFRIGSILDATALAEAMKGVDVVFHQAALPSVWRSVADPMRSHDADTTGTLAVLIAARDADAKVIYAGSSSAYGDPDRLPTSEREPTRPQSPYAVAKLAGEHYCHAFNRVYGLPTISLRYFNVFGPRQDPSSEYSAVIPRFVTSLLNGESPVVFGDGSQSRDFTYVDNVVQANILASRRGEGSWGKTFNVAHGERTSLLELLELLSHLLNVPAHPVFSSARPGDVAHSQADITAVREAIGYVPTVRLEDGLRATIRWIRGTSPVADDG